MFDIRQTPQFQRGMKIEAFLDQYFGQKFNIHKTTPDQERRQCLGDRIYTGPDQAFFVEYKSGIQTYYTGNVFLETISVDREPQKPGWVYTCQADYLLYATLLNGTILVFRPDKLRAMLGRLEAKYKTRKTSKGQNVGYKAHGLVIPYHEALTLADKVLNIKTG